MDEETKRTFKIHLDGTKIIGTRSDYSEVEEGWQLIEDDGMIQTLRRYPFDWLFVDGQLVKDEEGIAEREALEAKLKEIADLKQKLADTDFNITKFSESLLSVTSIVELLKIIASAKTDLAEVVSNRAEWRKRLEELGQ